MPRGDGTGPMGMGSMTGRGAGYCTGYSSPGFASGRGSGRGRGRRPFGLGFRRMFAGDDLVSQAMPSQQPVDEKAALKNQETLLEGQLRQVKERLKDLGEK